MLEMKTLLSRFPAPGTLRWIGLRPARKAPVEEVTQAELTGAGLVGDHYSGGGKRAVTLIQAEHLPVIATFAGLGTVPPALLRRNLVIGGVNLAALRNRVIAIGSAEVEITGPCAPCSRMETLLGPGGYNAMRGHGGWYARVVTPGALAIGAPVMLSGPQDPVS